ncbi:MAG: dynamin family protein, partial [Kiritimatiellae bacterium]|nr:dynamin family protein [Kiritimatiellia bacterium]
MFGFSRSTADIEDRVNRVYKAFDRTARRYHYEFRRVPVVPGALPTVVLLGNHSSGKSTIVNDLVGDPPVQETGVAPTDDAFTVLLFGEEEREFFGPAALGQAPAEFKCLAALGPDFLQHFAVKFRNREFLRRIQLIDSPGMIDTPSGTVSRSYDFTAAVRAFADLADIVLFLFDPEKPGTTGESVDVLSASLRGIEFKLRVLLNKADTFDSMEDYARAYGTLCWNLARVLDTKDLPPLYSTFTPSTAARLAARVPLDSFERNRAKILDLVHSAGTRRLDSVLAAFSADFSRLAIQARMLGAIRRRLFRRGALSLAAGLGGTAAAAIAAWIWL